MFKKYKFISMLIDFVLVGLGIVHEDEEDGENQIVDSVISAVEKSVPDLVKKSVKKEVDDSVDEKVDAKIKELTEKSLAESAEIKAELKKLSLTQKQSPEVKKAFTETAMVSIMKRIWNENVSSEAWFKSVVESEMKAMNEGTAWEGAELVFDQFQRDILKVINEYSIVASVKTLNIAKWDLLNIPKATNEVSTTYVVEGWSPTDTEAVTEFVTFNIYKAVSLVNMTDELMNDSMTIPDIYGLIVEFIWESQAEFLENEIINGTGTNAIEGILNNADINEVQLAAGERVNDIDDDVITDVITTAAMKFKRKSAQVKWVGSQYTYGRLRRIKTSDGYPLYPELRNMSNPYLEGYKFEISDKMSIQNAAEDIPGAASLIFGDLKYFTLVRRKALMLEKGYYGDNWKNGIQLLKGTSRMWGKPTFGEAFTVLLNGAT